MDYMESGVKEDEEDMWIMLLNSGRADVQMGASGDMLEVKARLTGIPCPGHLERGQ